MKFDVHGALVCFSVSLTAVSAGVTIFAAFAGRFGIAAIAAVVSIACATMFGGLPND